jgi:single-strand DNA-binding protein
MAGVNKVILVGRLGQDPEIKSLSPQSKVANFSIATSETWLKDGQKQERTEWHRIVAWGKLADTCGRFLTKGKQVYIEGKLQTRSWEDQQGQKKYATEIVATTVQFLSPAGERDNSSQQNTASSNDYGTQDFGPEPQFDASEEIPF